MKKRTLLQRMLCVLLSACMLAGLFTSLDGTFLVKAASDEMDEYTYTNENNEKVTVRVSRTNGDFEYISFPFGYDTRGGYVFAIIDPVGDGKKQIQVWLSEGGPCGDKTVCNSWEEYLSSGKLLKSGEVGENFDSAYGDYEKSMFWFSEKDFKFTGEKSEVATMISEYLQEYMNKYFKFVYYENFKNDVYCDVIWGNSVQLLDHSVYYSITAYWDYETDHAAYRYEWNETALSLGRSGTSTFKKRDWTVYEDGTGLTSNNGRDDLGCRVSAGYMSHCRKNSASTAEKICYSAAEMDEAQYRLVGTDGKTPAVSPGTLGANIAAQAKGFATPKNSPYNNEHWNAKVIVKIKKEDLYRNIKVMFYDREKIDTDSGAVVQVSNFSPTMVSAGENEVTVTGWEEQIPKNYVLATGTLDKYPAFHVGQSGVGVTYAKYRSGNSSMGKGTLNIPNGTYHIDSIPTDKYTVVWIPIEPVRPLMVQYWDVNTGKEISTSANSIGGFAEGDIPGMINVESILSAMYDGKYQIDWDRGSGTNGFFEVRGSEPALYSSKEAAVKDSDAVYLSRNVSVENPCVNLLGRMFDVPYTVLWIPVVNRAQRIDVIFIDSETGKQLGDTVTRTDIDRDEEYTPAVPSGYDTTENGKYKSKGAYLKSESKKKISESYSNLLGSGTDNRALDYDKKDYSFKVPKGDETYVSCKLYIPIKKSSKEKANLFVHYYDSYTGEGIGASGTSVGYIPTGSVVEEFSITDAAAIPENYIYDGGNPLTVYGSSLSDTAHNFKKAKGLSSLKGSITADGKTLFGKTSDKVPSGTKYVCMWVPVKKAVPDGKIDVRVELINADTGEAVADSKVSVPGEKGKVLAILDEVDIPDGFTVDNTRTYRAKAAYSGMVVPLDCAYGEMGSYTSIRFLDYTDYSIQVPNLSGSVGVKVFLPVTAVSPDQDVKKANVIYYDISSGKTLDKETGYSVTDGASTFAPPSVRSSLLHDGVLYGRVSSNTYMYYTAAKNDISSRGYKSVSGLMKGTVVNEYAASVRVPTDAVQMNIYIGMSAGDCVLSVCYVDADTGVTIDRETNAGHFSNMVNTYGFSFSRTFSYGGKTYSIVSAAKDSSCRYPSMVFYDRYRTDPAAPDVTYDDALAGCPSSYVKIPGEGNGGKARLDDGSIVFGPWPSGYTGTVIRAYIPCRAARHVEIHCVDKDNSDKTDFLASYDLWVQPGADVSQALDNFNIGGIIYRPVNDGSDIAIAFDDTKSVISYDSAKASSYVSVTHSLRNDGGTLHAVTVEADKTGRHTVMYVLYAADAPKVMVEYVTLREGEVDSVLLTEDGGNAKYNEKYSYSGDASITVGGVQYNVTGEDHVLAYGGNAYSAAIADTKNRKGVPVSYNGSGKWTTEKKYSSHEDGTLYIPVEADGYPVTVKYITLKSDGNADRVVATLDGGNAVTGKKYTYEGETTVTGTDGKKYSVLGEKEAFSYGSNSYKNALADTGNTKGSPVKYTAGADGGKWTTEKKVKKADRGTLYIPVRSGVPATVIYVDSEDNRHILETPGKPGEEGKKYNTPYQPAVQDGEKTYIPDSENPPKYTFSEEPYKPSLKTPANDPDEPSVTTPKVPTGTPSIIIYIPMVKEEEPEAPEPETAGIDKLPEVKAKIKSRDFDVEKAIPSTEYEYAEITADGYTIKVKMHSVSGRKSYTVHATQTVYSDVTKYDADGNPDGFDRTTSYDSADYTVYRPFSYWLIDEIGYYTLDSIEITNGSIDDPLRYIVTAKDCTFPVLDYSAKATESAHIREPQASHVYVTAPDLYYVDGVITSGMTVGSYAASEAYWIGDIRCSNDSLTFGGQTVLDDREKAAAAPEPNLAPIEKAPPKLKLETDELQIPTERKNILYDDSKGTAVYTPKAVYKSVTGQQKIQIKDINPVKVHTPVYNRTGVIEDNLKYVQSLSSDKDKYHVVVGRSESYGSSGHENDSSDFRIEVRTDGKHINEKGYGTRDYLKYVLGYGSSVNNTAYPKGVQVMFPIEVVADVGNDMNESNDIVLEAGKWYPIYARYYVPEWVKAGTYTCQVRVLACNSKGNYDAVQKYANLSDSNYAAYDEFELEVSGKMYGLTLTSNNSTAPDWKDVFTLSGKIKNAMPKKYADGTFSTKFDRDYRYYYMAGLKNELGLDMWAVAGGKTLYKDSRFVYPLLAGSSPALKGSGMLKSGYTWNFKLDTAGNITANEGSTLEIVPTFYWVSKDGTKREKVDLWYAGKVDGKTYNYIKAGSSVDMKNTFIDYAASDTMGIPAAEIEFVDGIRKEKDTTTANTVIYTYGGIKLAKNTKTYTNDTYAKLFASKQSMFSETQLRQLKQTWYFRYSLPDVYHLCAEGYDVEGYVKKNGGCTYKEDFWKKDGYLVVHFDIIAKDRDGVPTLAYTNTVQNVLDGMCDMWKMEGYQNIRTDSNGKTFSFVDGDVIIVALPGSTDKNPPANLSEDKEVNRLN